MAAEDVTVKVLTGGAKVKWEFPPLCDFETEGRVNCPERFRCTVDGKRGWLHHVIRNGAGVGSVCFTEGEADTLSALDPGWVASEFRRLQWPSSELTIQPPEGETLVNLETNLFTTNERPISQVVTLLGLRIEIEATPTSYTWQHGDGTAQTTSGPGAPYPALEVTHQYREAGDVTPSVDTTYSGRFRVGGGAWHDIPETLTVAGDPVPLTVLEAKPQLVGGDS